MNEAIKSLAKILQARYYIITFTGGGISTESGISNFRSKGEGLEEKTELNYCARQVINKPIGETLMGLVNYL